MVEVPARVIRLATLLNSQQQKTCMCVCMIQCHITLVKPEMWIGSGAGMMDEFGGGAGAQQIFMRKARGGTERGTGRAELLQYRTISAGSSCRRINHVNCKGTKPAVPYPWGTRCGTHWKLSYKENRSERTTL